MGSLALWGAMAGGGKAGKEVFAREQEADIRAREKTLDEAREERMMKIKEKYASEREQRGYAHAEKLQGEKIEAEKTLQESEYRLKGKETEKERSFKEESQIREIQAEWDRAVLKSETDKATSGSSGKSSRYQSVMVKNSSMTPEGGFEEKEQPVVFDKDTGEHLIKQGDKFVPYDLRGGLPYGEQKLYDNPSPEAAKEFVNSAYGKRVYQGKLPQWYTLMYGAAK